MKSQWFTHSSYYEFAKLIDAAGQYRGMRSHEIFDRFLFCAYASCRQAVNMLQNGKLDAALENEYLKTIATIPAPKLFAEAMGFLVNELERDPRDFLGDVYQQIGMAEKNHHGQCFTPFHLCTLMAEMNLPATPDPSHRLAIAEPCVGGGAIVIALSKVLRSRNFTPHNYFVWCGDISNVCFHMAYVQLTLLGVPAVVTRGDSLWPQPTDAHAPTMLAAMFPYREPPAVRRRVVVPDEAEPLRRRVVVPEDAPV